MWTLENCNSPGGHQRAVLPRAEHTGDLIGLSSLPEGRRLFSSPPLAIIPWLPLVPITLGSSSWFWNAPFTENSVLFCFVNVPSSPMADCDSPHVTSLSTNLAKPPAACFTHITYSLIPTTIPTDRYNDSAHLTDKEMEVPRGEATCPFSSWSGIPTQTWASVHPADLSYSPWYLWLHNWPSKMSAEWLHEQGLLKSEGQLHSHCMSLGKPLSSLDLQFPYLKIA